jgi:hypothetical protein
MRSLWVSAVVGLVVGLAAPAGADLRGEVIHGANCEASPDFSIASGGAVGGLANSQGMYVWGPADVTCGLTMGSHSFTGGALNWPAGDLKLAFVQVSRFSGGGNLKARLLFQEALSGVNHWGPEAVATGSTFLTLFPPAAMPSAPWHASVQIWVEAKAVFAVRDVNPLWWN